MDPLTPSPSVTEIIASTEAVGTMVELSLLEPLLVAVTALVVGLLLVYRRHYPGLTPILIGVVSVAALFGVISLLVGTVD